MSIANFCTEYGFESCREAFEALQLPSMEHFRDWVYHEQASFQEIVPTARERSSVRTALNAYIGTPPPFSPSPPTPSFQLHPSTSPTAAKGTASRNPKNVSFSRDSSDGWSSMRLSRYPGSAFGDSVGSLPAANEEVLGDSYRARSEVSVAPLRVSQASFLHETSEHVEPPILPPQGSAASVSSPSPSPGRDADGSEAAADLPRRRPLVKSYQRLTVLRESRGCFNDIPDRQVFEPGFARKMLEQNKHAFDLAELRNAYERQLLELKERVFIAEDKASLTGNVDEIMRLRTSLEESEAKRKILHNTVQELKGSIRVYCRVRPAETCVFQFPSDTTVCVPDAGRTRMLSYEVDKVFPPSIAQEDVFHDTAELITSVIDGFKVCVFAYGQTGAGKTYTMNGSTSSPGINRRAMKHLFNELADRNMDSNVSMSIIEIYNDQIRDLLVESSTLSIDLEMGSILHGSSSRGGAASGSGDEEKRVPTKPSKFKINTRDDGPPADGLVVVPVKSVADVDRTLEQAMKVRSVASTQMNTDSSRSHLLVSFDVTTWYREVQGDAGPSPKQLGRLWLIDLAGSERLDKSGATGQAAKEAMHINQSLTHLGNVMMALATKQKHVPYRNCKLTHILENSLAYSAKVLMFVCLNPHEDHILESNNTMRFAMRVGYVAHSSYL